MYPLRVSRDVRALLEEIERRMIQEALEDAARKAVKPRRRTLPGSQSSPPSSAAPAALSVEVFRPQKKI
jgi:hypothetical protein